MKKDIQIELKEILREKLKISGDLQWERVKDIPLTSDVFSFDGLNLYYLLMLIEEKFSVIFRKEDFKVGSFYTLSNIENMILEKQQAFR